MGYLEHLFFGFQFLEGSLLPLNFLLIVENLGLEFVDDRFVVGSVFGLLLGDGDKYVEVGLLEQLDLFLQVFHLHPQVGLLLHGSLQNLQVLRTSKVLHQ